VLLDAGNTDAISTTSTITRSRQEIGRRQEEETHEAEG